MSHVLASITMSLDGFIAGINDHPDQPMGEKGENLHNWILEGDYLNKHNDFFMLSKKNRDIFDEMFDSTGALIAGRRTYDIVHGWEGSYPVSGVPVFVLTHEPPVEAPKGHTEFTFVTESIQQAINSGLCDELHIHMVPQLLGNGIKLLECLEIDHILLNKTNVIDTSDVTHIHFSMKQHVVFAP